MVRELVLLMLVSAAAGMIARTDVLAYRAETQETALQRIHSGLPAYSADDPPKRQYGLIYPLVSLDGGVLGWEDRRHPYH